MLTTSWLKLKTRKRLNNKGFSSIVGAIFMILIIGLMASAYFMYTLAENSKYNDAIKANNNDEISLMSESINITSSPTYTLSNNTVSVTANLQNDGPVYVQIKTLWVHGVNNNFYGFADLSNSNINLLPGQTYTLSTPVRVQGASAGQTYYGWIITERGKTVSLYPAHQTGPQGVPGPQGNPGNTSYNAQTSLVSQGIGVIAMNFSLYSHYDYASGGVTDGTVLTNPNPTYTIGSSNTTILHVVVINEDPTRSITLTSGSSIWASCPFSGTVKSDKWNLLDVTNNKAYPSNTTYTIILPPNGTQTSIYFGPAGGQGTLKLNSAGNVVALNILLFGTIGGQDYGQNLPFIALNVLN